MRTPQTDPATQPGNNRTGIQPHPELARVMLEGTEEFGPTSSGSVDSVAAVRVRYAREADPTGTMPPSEKVVPERLPLLDKLGARLQFERTGTRLYEALISKLDAYGSFPDGPSRADLKHLRDEEHHHVILAQEMIRQLGGDPTALTPCANLQATAARGITEVLVDARTNLIECLDAILVAELTDQESWRGLVSLVKQLGEKDLIDKVEKAEQTEVEHLTKVRAWIAAADKVRSTKTR